MKRPRKTVIMNLSEICGFGTSHLPKNIKMELAKERLNPSRFRVVTVLGRSTNVVVEPRFNTRRDKKTGRFV